MPYALVCHQLETRSERRQCSDLVLKNIIRKNLQYPPDAADYEGVVFVSLIIRKDGSRGEARIRRGGPASINQEALRLAELFPSFHPGSFMRHPADVELNIPIRFPQQ
ncbi:energy transducer TonB [Flavilitoribacter nigricans]